MEEPTGEGTLDGTALVAHIEEVTSHLEPMDRCRTRAGIYARIYSASDDRDEVSSETAIELLHEAVRLNDGVLSADIAKDLADIHFERLRRLGLKEDADEVDRCARVVLQEHPNDPESVYKLMRVLQARYSRTFSPSHVDEALELAERSISLLDTGDEGMPLLLGACGISLLDRSESQNCAESLDVAMELFLAAEILLETRRDTNTWFLVRGGHAETLRRRFEVSGAQTNLTEARAIVDGTPIPAWLQPPDALEFGMIRLRVLYAAWRITPNMEGLRSLRQEFAETQQRSFLKNHRTPVRAELTQASGKVINETFFSSGGRTGLGFTMIQSGLNFAEELLQNWGQSGNNAPGLAAYRHEMGLALEQQHDAYYSPTTLEEASMILMASSQSTDPNSAPFGLRAVHMVRALQKMAGLSVDSFAESARDLARMVLGSAMLHPLPIYLTSKASLASELGDYAVTTFENSQRSFFLDQAVRHYEVAVQMTLTDTSQLVHCLNYLATTLTRRGKATLAMANSASGDRAEGLKEAAANDFESAANTIERINELGHQKNFTNLDNFETLGDIREQQFKITQNLDHARDAITAWTRMCKSKNINPVARWASAVKMAALQQDIAPLIGGNLANAADSLAECVEVTLDLISDSDLRNEQIWKIRLFAQLSSHAASVGLLAGKPPEEILAIMERGRSLVWTQLLNRKVDISALREKHAALADRFLELQSKLSTQQSQEAVVPALEKLTFNETLESNRFHVNEEYHQTIQEIRQKPGFEDFLLPLVQSGGIKNLASQGPVVVFVQSGDCHAIVITTDNITPIYLPDFGRDECERRFAVYEEYLKLRDTDLTKSSELLESILTWLWTAAAKLVISSIYASLGLNMNSPPTELPRVWWVCSGWVNTYPIHAAGDHQKAIAATSSSASNPSGERFSAMDLIISSYTPTLQVLEYTRRTMSRMISQPSPTPSALLVGMKFTPDKRPDLPNAVHEVAAISSILTSSSYTVKTLGNPSSVFHAPATRKSAVLALRTATLALFACHGAADAASPLASLLFLQDWRRRPFNVTHLLRMDFDHLRLVLLSACDMAVGRDALLRDEGLHMGGAFLMAGVPNTVATWWPVLDAMAAEVSVGVVRGLVVDGESDLDIGRTANALWRALRSMRDRGVSPAIWGAYAHFGV